ncbi:hypothetical protein BOFE_01060 [Candidatus Borrelia fainii]|uniref:DNA 5'-3' helicase n=1 Tax=Candidatus Borrelia fainii TaxID=2518322 RepID=A0ABM8DJ01_9SPIR|nr:DnaB-like helicase C-terminal domain-containing protein [Candidatus Borrelia fainii]BDU62566.1 hypothetical protein BOFE_01060 [Candidatus Borrelia fainii]
MNSKLDLIGNNINLAANVKRINFNKKEEFASYETEKRILSGLMQDNTLIDFVDTEIKPRDFYYPDHQIIYHYISKLYNQNYKFDEETRTREFNFEEIFTKYNVNLKDLNPFVLMAIETKQKDYFKKLTINKLHRDPNKTTDNDHDILMEIKDRFQTRIIDPEMVFNAITKEGKYLKDMNFNSLLELIDYRLANESNIKDHVKTIKELSIKRTLHYELNTIVANLKSTPLNDVLNKITALSFSDKILHEPSYDEYNNDVKKHLDIVLKTIWLRINSSYDPSSIGYKTGFKGIDNIIDFFDKGNFIILAARTSIGKTALALNIAYNLIKNDHKVVYFSLEMSSRTMTTRYLSIMSNMKAKTLYREPISKDDYYKIDDIREHHKRDMLYFNDKPNIDLMDLCTEIRKYVRNKGIEVVFVDYIGLISFTRERSLMTHYERVSFISKTLKEMSSRLEIPIIAMAQVNRDAQDKEPTLANIRDSGALEQDADMVIFMHREEKQTEVENSDFEDEYPTEIKIIVAKNRNGNIGRCSLNYYASCLTFKDTNR